MEIVQYRDEPLQIPKVYFFKTSQSKGNHWVTKKINSLRGFHTRIVYDITSLVWLLMCALPRWPGSCMTTTYTARGLWPGTWKRCTTKMNPTKPTISLPCRLSELQPWWGVFMKNSKKGPDPLIYGSKYRGKKHPKNVNTPLDLEVVQWFMFSTMFSRHDSRARAVNLAVITWPW